MRNDLPLPEFWVKRWLVVSSWQLDFPSSALNFHPSHPHLSCRRVSSSFSSSSSSSCYRARGSYLKLCDSSRSNRWGTVSVSYVKAWSVLTLYVSEIAGLWIFFRLFLQYHPCFCIFLQIARMVSALQQQQQRQPGMKHSPSHPVGPKPHIDSMVPNPLNVGLSDLQSKGQIPGYGSGKCSHGMSNLYVITRTKVTRNVSSW